MTETSTRLGVIIPSTNTTVEREITSLARKQVDWFVTRVLQVETDDPGKKVGTVLAMQDELGPATERLTGLEPAAIGFACTAASFLKGAESDIELCENYSQALGIPFLTASRAVSLALGALGATRVALVTPYIEEVYRKEVSYFADLSIEVTASSGLGIVGNLPKGRLPVEASLDAARSIDVSGADALFISCTNWLTLANLGVLAAELGVPVISSNSALAWAMIRAARVEGRVEGIGVLDEVPWAVAA